MVASKDTSESRVALYARVSTVDKGQDPEVQLSELRQYSRNRSWSITRNMSTAGSPEVESPDRNSID